MSISIRIITCASSGADCFLKPVRMTVFIFIFSALFSLALLYYGTGRQSSLLVFITAWMILSGIAAGTGFLQQTDALPPRMFWIIAPSVLLVVVLYRRLSVPGWVHPYTLLAVHLVRIPVEWGLYGLYREGLVPEIMTFEGWNFDILTGMSAGLLCGYHWFSGKRIPGRLLIAWNIAGMLLLAVIVVIALLSVPSPVQQLAFARPNVAVAMFPYVYLPAIIVPLVLLAHLLSLKVLLGRAKAL